eukprot:2711137-Prymnesium_polylepis.1
MLGQRCRHAGSRSTRQIAQLYWLFCSPTSRRHFHMKPIAHSAPPSAQHSAAPPFAQVYYMRFKDKGDFGTLSTFVTPEREAR